MPIPTSTSDIPRSLPSALNHLLRSNDWPSPQEEMLIAESTRLVDNLLFVNPAPSPSQQERQRTIQKIRDELKIIRAPVRRLPAEILKEIFLAMDNLVVFDHTASHYVIGRVCRAWRTVSQDCCPQIWCQLEINIIKWEYIVDADIRLRAVLAHTCGSPISFSLRYEGNEPHNETFSLLLEVLAECSMQWESVRLIGLRMNEAYVLSAIRGRIPVLKCLHLEIPFQDETKVTHVIRAFEIAPALVDASLDNVPLGHVALPPRNLKSLTVSPNYDYGMIFFLRDPPLCDVLRNSPELSTVHLDYAMWELEMDKTQPPIAPPRRAAYANLVSLKTSDFGSFCHITLPNLKELCVGPRWLDEANELIAFLPAVRDLLRHSQCQLSHLSLWNGEWTLDLLCEVFDLAAEVEQLTVAYDDRYEDTLDMLKAVIEALFRTVSSVSDVALLERRPRYLTGLRTLALKTRWWECVDKAFVDMVALRVGEAELSILLKCQWTADGDDCESVFPNLERCDWDRLMAMKKGGFDLHWGNKDRHEVVW